MHDRKEFNEHISLMENFFMFSMKKKSSYTTNISYSDISYSQEFFNFSMIYPASDMKQRGKFWRPV